MVDVLIANVGSDRKISKLRSYTNFVVRERFTLKEKSRRDCTC